MNTATPPAPSPATRKLALAALFTSFAALGFFSSVAGAMVPAIRVIFGLGLSAAISVQWMPLVGGGLFSLPLAQAMERFGAVRMVMAGLLLAALGCLAVCGVMAFWWQGTGGFALLLAALLLLSAGSTALQVAINPLAIAMGDPHSGPARLTLAQAMNSLGVLAGVHMASALVLERIDDGPRFLAGGIVLAYAACALFLLGILLLCALAMKGSDPARVERATLSPAAALRCRWAVAGAMCIALYVGAEGALGSIMTSYLHQSHILGVSLAVAGQLVANAYWGGPLIGRLGGAVLLGRWRPAALLCGVALAAAAACGVALAGAGVMAAAAALGIGLCNAIMFPVIFALTLEKTSAPQSAASGLMVLAISGGALVSVLVGVVGDRAGVGAAFAIPLLAYLAIAGFGFAAATNRRHPATAS